jgi:hypothetical protein
MDVSPSLITDPQAPELMQPRKGAFDHPAKDTQAAPVGRPPARQDREDAEASQGLSVRGRVVGAIPLDAIGAVPRVADLAADGIPGTQYLFPEHRNSGDTVLICCSLHLGDISLRETSPR